MRAIVIVTQLLIDLCSETCYNRRKGAYHVKSEGGRMDEKTACSQPASGVFPFLYRMQAAGRRRYAKRGRAGGDYARRICSYGA